MDTYDRCLICGGEMVRRDTPSYGIGAYIVECPKRELGTFTSHHAMWYDNDGDMDEYAIVLSNGYRINSVVKDSCNYLQTKITCHSKEVAYLKGVSIPFTTDLEYLANKVKTIVVFG